MHNIAISSIDYFWIFPEVFSLNLYVLVLNISQGGFHPQLKVYCRLHRLPWWIYIVSLVASSFKINSGNRLSNEILNKELEDMKSQSEYQ